MLEKVNDDVMRLADNQFLFQFDESLMWLFNTDTGDCWKLNEPTYFVLSSFDGQKTIKEIGQLYSQRYLQNGVNERELMEDFKKLINQLIISNTIIQAKTRC